MGENNIKPTRTKDEEEEDHSDKKAISKFTSKIVIKHELHNATLIYSQFSCLHQCLSGKKMK